MQAAQYGAYPVQYSIDYPDRPLDRLTSAFRILVAIPILILIGAVSGSTWQYNTGHGTTRSVISAGGLLFFGPLLMLVFRRKYPRWWFDWNLELLRFSNRVWVYVGLMNDRYPSTDEQQAVHLDIPYPDAQQLNRWLPLVKWLLALPHYIVLVFLGIGALVASVIAWFAILFTGTYPRGLFDYIEGVFRWSNRVIGYAWILVTDEYPPFSLNP